MQVQILDFDNNWIDESNDDCIDDINNINDIEKFVKEEYKEKVKSELEKLNDGDLIDFVGYRGQGLYYVDNESLIKTTGEYGYFLPSQAWKYVKKYGMDYYYECLGEYILIPENCKIIICNEESKFIPIEYDKLYDDFPTIHRHLDNPAISIHCQTNDNEYILIDDIKYNLEITTFY